ncbi:hypothetical protein MIND_00064500 [Mycena indigotica]|uniref:Coilin n=1 Tax=Mycena indigotica TaxID=2126181 RepID=A0A8H6TF07_9AGAR|nr:uncharacterized protein MIND_00064500 [Mycena indigotica]KAF7315492.1 hypothetical protein MIND_00064500 [Mycena indigotica]
MRLKIQCSQPPLKFWFAPGDHECCTTIGDLKSALTKLLDEVKPLKLALDGFELLDRSQITHVLRDGDLVVVASSGRSGTKRKRSNSTSSSSSSSDSSSSESESDSDSDSSSSSSSASSSPAKPPPISSSKPNVPPGQGKPSTRSRNARRKLKALALKTATATLPAFLSATNSTPIAPVEVSIPLQSEAEETLRVQMMSMLPKSKNKNKSRRNFDRTDAQARKIVFDQEETASRPAFIPPSALPPERIPPNVFITSIDVEEGIRRRPRQSQRPKQEYMQDVQTVLDEKVVGLDWDNSPIIDSHSQLAANQIIGFSGLIIDMTTMSPVIGKRLGRVQSWTDEFIVVTRGIEGPHGFEDEEVEEELDWSEVQGQWKILQA